MGARDRVSVPAGGEGNDENRGGSFVLLLRRAALDAFWRVQAAQGTLLLIKRRTALRYIFGAQLASHRNLSLAAKAYQ